MYEVWTDGACRAKKIGKKFTNIGHCAIGVVIKKNNEVIHTHSKYIGEDYDNNQAEYEALIYAVDYMIELGASSVKFYTDSNLVEKQMTDKYGAYAESIVPFYMKAKKLLYMIPEWNIKWIPRDLNKEADKLASIAVEEKLKQLQSN